MKRATTTVTVPKRNTHGGGHHTTPTAPSAPQGVGAVAGDGQATVSWSAPLSSGGSTITGYTVTASPGGATGQTSGLRTKVITGLTNGTEYTFTVTATNAVGTGPASSASAVVTPHAAATVPGDPIGVTAIAGNGQATVSWSAPASNGGSPITGYTVTSSPGGFTGTTSGTTRTISGLTNGTEYTFTVTATNAVGTGAASSPSAGVTPVGDAAAWRPYDSAAPWNTPIGASPTVHASSATFITAISDNGLPLTCDPDQYTIPVYSFSSSTPLATVNGDGFYSSYDAGDSSRVGHGSPWQASMPVPAGIAPSDGSDGQVELLDQATGIQYGFWQLVDDGDGTWSCSNAYRYHTGAGYNGRFADGLAGRGAGTPYLAGLVRRAEIDAGLIEHALAFAYNSPSGQFVYPASKSDGGGFGGVNGTDLPEGSRLQLDPTLDDTDFDGWGLGTAARVIARALQTYGAFVIDHSGSSKVYIEDRMTADWGDEIDRHILEGIPWSAFRVLVPVTP